MILESSEPLGMTAEPVLPGTITEELCSYLQSCRQNIPVETKGNNKLKEINIAKKPKSESNFRACC